MLIQTLIVTARHVRQHFEILFKVGDSRFQIITAHFLSPFFLVAATRGGAARAFAGLLTFARPDKLKFYFADNVIRTCLFLRAIASIIPLKR